MGCQTSEATFYSNYLNKLKMPHPKLIQTQLLKTITADKSQLKFRKEQE